ncbi:hypothetical protein [Pandoraea sp. XY-2]|uniref:hypothetical protein n=1 Tax=Pandoraea sp. XY-2 TaxID=2518599 RepID=UPI00101AF2FD|nr:hypothetical protein [Pandoraea sp. XY-2]QBC31377.1 hypothetical protein DRB87_08420 [Pandoraea sp. XY-2]
MLASTLRTTGTSVLPKGVLPSTANSNGGGLRGPLAPGLVVVFPLEVVAILAFADAAVVGAVPVTSANASAKRHTARRPWLV